MILYRSRRDGDVTAARDRVHTSINASSHVAVVFPAWCKASWASRRAVLMIAPSRLSAGGVQEEAAVIIETSFRSMPRPQIGNRRISGLGRVRRGTCVVGGIRCLAGLIATASRLDRAIISGEP